MKTIFFDVDTQEDLIKKEGALPVPNAEALKPNLKKLTDYALQNEITIIGSVDRHSGDDPELMRNGGPFPDHCMDGTEGQKKIRETTTQDTIFIENRDCIVEGYDTALNHQQIILEKQDYNVETNPNFERLLRYAKPERAVVYGVATDYCVKAAVLGLRQLGMEVHVVIDAIQAVNVQPDDGKQALEDMVNAGAHIIRMEEVIRGDWK